MNVGTFFIDSIIVHDVPRRKPGDSVDAIVFSDVASNLNADLKNFFKERIVRSLQGQAFEVEQDPDQASPVPEHVATILNAPSTLVKRSQNVAEHLFLSQSRVPPAGLLVFCTGRVDNTRCMSVLKLEREDALSLEQVGQDGAKTFDMQLLSNLMLGKNTRVFKASVFTLTPGGDSIVGRVSDDQRGYESNTEIAQFFLEKFLGCKLAKANHLATKALFEKTQAWINGEVANPSTKARYEIGLLAYLTSNRSSLSTKSFADTTLDAADRTQYKAFMKANDVSTATIIKDLSLIGNKVEQMTMATQKGIRVTGTAETMRQHVAVHDDGPSGPRIEIRDELESVRGGKS